MKVRAPVTNGLIRDYLFDESDLVSGVHSSIFFLTKVANPIL